MARDPAGARHVLRVAAFMSGPSSHERLASGARRVASELRPAHKRIERSSSHDAASLSDDDLPEGLRRMECLGRPVELIVMNELIVV